MKFVGSFIIIFLFCFQVYAQDVATCVPIESSSAAKMVVELEKCKIVTEQLDNQSSQLFELKGQVVEYKEMILLYQQKEELYKQIILLQGQQITSAEEALKKYREHIDFVQKSYQELLRDAKPNPVWETFKTILGMGAGVALGYGIGK